MRSKLSILGILLFLLASNLMIAGKERSLQNGRTVILELMPVDPRSLMQGDYMTLRYKLASELQPPAAGEGVIYLTLDSRGVATTMSTTASPGQIPLRYRSRDRRVLFDAESYFFQEGQGEFFQTARYGQLQVDQGGMPILTGLLDEQLHPIIP